MQERKQLQRSLKKIELTTPEKASREKIRRRGTMEGKGVLLKDSNFWTAFCALAMLAVTVLPFLLIAGYVWPCSDDFEMGLLCKKTLEETGNFWQVIKSAGEYAAEQWQTWQGTFFSLFLMALQPGIWGDEYYVIGVVLVILSLIVSTFTLTYVLMVKQAKASKALWLILTSMVMWGWLLRVMYTEEAFYWWTGASHYTGFHSWVMLMIALTACIYTDWGAYGSLKKVILYLGCIPCFLLGGGNYVSALLQVMVLAGYFAAAIITKKRNRAILCAYTAAAVGGLLLSVLAPGNFTHMNYDGLRADISVAEAIFIAIRDGLYHIYAWTHVQQVLLFLLLAPFVWTMARRSGCKFRVPLVVMILSGGLYLAEYMPTSYSYGGYEPGRITNLYYWNYHWLILFNLYYWIGWIDRKLRARRGEWLEKLAKRQNFWQGFYVLAALILFFGTMGIHGLRETNLGWVYAELFTGKYAMVDQFMQERVAYFEQHQGEDVAVENIPYKSVITYFGDLFPDADHLVNRTMAEYYGVKSITLK